MPTSSAIVGTRPTTQLSGRATGHVSHAVCHDPGKRIAGASCGPVDKSPQKRISIFLQDLAGGGAERIMLRLAGGLCRRGLQVDLVLVRANGPYLEDIPTDVRLIDLKYQRTLKAMIGLRRYLLVQRPTVLISALVHVNIAAILAARSLLNRPRIVVTEHNQFSRNASIASSLAVNTSYHLAPYVYGMADQIVAVSHGVASDLAASTGIRPERINVVHNPIVTDDIALRASERPTHPWFTNEKPRVIVGIGRLHAQKRFDLLIRAFSKLPNTEDVRLVIFGEGPERDALQRLISDLSLVDRVDLPGFVSNPYSHLARAAVFALSSDWEGLPTVLVEALACGTPAVSTNCPSGPEEILEGGTFGELVPVGDHKALAAAISAQLKQPKPPNSLRRRAADFSLDAALNRYLAICFEGVR